MRKLVDGIVNATYAGFMQVLFMETDPGAAVNCHFQNYINFKALWGRYLKRFSYHYFCQLDNPKWQLISLSSAQQVCTTCIE
jgi:hypothetical protein